MDYFLTAAELFEAQAEFDQWLAETGNDPRTIFENLVENTAEIDQIFA